MTIQFAIPSMEERNENLRTEKKRQFEEHLRHLLHMFEFGLPRRKGETVWFRVYSVIPAPDSEEYLIAEAARIYRENGYFMRPLYSSHRIDWDEVHAFTLFEMTELDCTNPKHDKVGWPGMFERIACRIQYRLGIPRKGRRYDVY